MTTQLEIYQQALLLLGEVPVASTSENREARRLCDFIWNAGFVDGVLEEGLWRFANRTAAIEYDTSNSPPFGFSRAFTLPSDFIRTIRLSQDERENVPLMAYTLEAGFIYCDLDEIFLRYVSNDTSYGGNLSNWPSSFASYAYLQMAIGVGPKLTASTTKMEALKKDAKRALAEARSRSAMEGPTQLLPQGSWSRSRSRGYGQRDGGSTTRFTG